MKFYAIAILCFAAVLSTEALSLQDIFAKAQEVLKDAAAKVSSSDAIQKAGEALKGAAGRAGDALQDAAQNAGDLLNNAGDKVDDAIDSAGSKAGALISGYGSNIKKNGGVYDIIGKELEKLGVSVSQLLNGLGDKAENTLESSGALLKNLVQAAKKLSQKPEIAPEVAPEVAPEN